VAATTTIIREEDAREQTTPLLESAYLVMHTSLYFA
jgi:hypothetical protein